jgi:DNA-binding XRE family transcriptional regulator
MPSAPRTAARRKYFAALGKTIARGRASAGLTQPQAAAALGVKEGTYVSWEHGRRECPAEIRQRVIDLWGVDPKALKLDGKPHCPTCGRPL